MTRKIKHIIRTLTTIMPAVLLSVASCTKQDDMEPDIDRPIVLSVTDDAKTILTGTEIPDSYTIYASSYFHNETAPETSDNYFIAKPFKSDSDSETWKSNPATYWPIGGYLDFLFVACEDSEFDLVSNAVWDENKCTDAVDINVPEDECLESEILFASTLNRRARQGSVPMTFSHSQCWLQFVLTTNKNIIRIDKIVLESAYSGGLLHIDNNRYTTAEWLFRGYHRKDVTVPGSEGLVITTDKATVCNVLVPEQEACSVAIYYSFKSTVEDDWDTAVQSVVGFDAAKDPWFYGEKRIYKANFTFEEVVFDVTVAPWIEVEYTVHVGS